MQLETYTVEILKSTTEKIFSTKTLINGGKANVEEIKRHLRFFYETYDFIPTIVGPIKNRALRAFYSQFLMDRKWKEKFKPITTYLSRAYPEFKNLEDPWIILTLTSGIFINIIAQSITKEYKYPSYPHLKFKILPKIVVKDLYDLFNNFKDFKFEINAELPAEYLLPLVLCLDRGILVGHNYADSIVKWILIFNIINKKRNINIHNVMEKIKRHMLTKDDTNLYKHFKDVYVPQLAIFVVTFNIGIVTIGNIYKLTSELLLHRKSSKGPKTYHFEPSPINIYLQFLLLNKDKAHKLVEFLNSIRISLILTRVQKTYIRKMKEVINKKSLDLSYNILKESIREVINEDPSLRSAGAVLFGTKMDYLEQTLFTYMYPLAEYYHYALTAYNNLGYIEENISGYLIPFISSRATRYNKLFRQIYSQK